MTMITPCHPDVCHAELEVRLRDALNRSSHVVLDLRRVGFIDCAGLRRMLDVQDAAREAGGHFAVIPFHFIDPGETAAT